MRRLILSVYDYVRRPPSLERILIETAVLLALHAAGVLVFSRLGTLESLARLDGGAGLGDAVAAGFLAYRAFVMVALPAWLSTRVWLFVSRPPARPRE
jgi:hypothetical protein